MGSLVAVPGLGQRPCPAYAAEVEAQIMAVAHRNSQCALAINGGDQATAHLRQLIEKRNQ